MASQESEYRAQAAGSWNVVITLVESTFRDARRLLGKWGRVKRTGFYNVLAMTVDDPAKFLAEFAAAAAETPGILNYISHVIPAQRTFDFDSAETFERQAREVMLAWAPRLAGKGFHVRLHRRGFKSTLPTQKEERLLSEAVFATLGASVRADFEDPDAVIQIETIDGRAGMSLWTREDLRRHPFLGKP